MRMADVLRQLADKLDKIENPGRSLEPGANPDTSDQDVFTPPLQSKIELLKKGVGVPSIYDDDDQEDTTELDAIKKNAGVNPVVIHMAADDEPVDM
jgi:hypothetical protein